MATAEETKQGGLQPPVQKPQTAARAEEPANDDSGQLKRFAEVGKLAVDIRKREESRKLYHECLKELGAWAGLMAQPDLDPALPAVLRPLVDMTKLQELGRRVNSGESIDVARERMNQLVGRF